MNDTASQTKTTKTGVTARTDRGGPAVDTTDRTDVGGDETKTKVEGGGGTLAGDQHLTSRAMLDLTSLGHGRRLHMFFIAMYVMNIVTTVGSRNTSALGLMNITGSILGITASAAVVTFVKEPGKVGLSLMLPIALISAVAGFSVTYYIGFYSPVVAFYGISIYVASSNSSNTKALAIITYASAVLIYGIGTIGLVTGALPPFGLVAPPSSPAVLIIGGGAIQLFFVATYIYGHRNAKAMHLALERFENALREVHQRDALLNEAKQDLERVIHARGRGGGGGRATGMVVGSWQLGALLGRGGMGEVYEAIHVTDARVAAVKLLPDDALRDPDAAARFRREARVLGELDDPHVVKVFDVGDMYIAMELLEGSDLAAMLRTRRSLSLDEVVTLVTHVAGGLEAARKADVVHRDVKPQNIFFVEKGSCASKDGEAASGGLVSASGTWKVLDFGVSKLGQGGTLTQNMIVGTPAYMAPEQLNSLPVDHRADVFALAVVAFRAITGQPAFSGSDSAQVFYDVLYTQPPQPSSLAVVSPDVDLALALGLTKSPADRIGRATELAAALADASRGALSESLRRRATALVAKHGWGERLLAK